MHNSFSPETVLPSFSRIIVSLFDLFILFIYLLLTLTFFDVKVILFWWFLKDSYKNYVLYCSFFLSVKDLDFKYLLLNLDRFIISLCKLFCHKRCLLCSSTFLFSWNILIENWKPCFLETIYITFIKSTGFYIRLKFIIIKIFIIALSYYMRLKFLKHHFEFCYRQQMKIGKVSLKNITVTKHYSITMLLCL